MKFLVSGAPEALSRARPPVRAFTLFSLVLCAALMAQRAAAGQLTSTGVVDAFLPDGEALPMVALLEELHGAGFVWAFLLLSLGSLVVASPVSARLRTALVWGPAAFSALDLAAPFIVVARPELAWLRVASGPVVALWYAAAALVVLARFGRQAPRG